jgi:hypothetical protein
MRYGSESFSDLAVSALEAEGRPMRCGEIIKWARKKGRLSTEGKTPENTLYAILFRSISNDRHSPFAKKGRGLFALKIGTGGQ